MIDKLTVLQYEQPVADAYAEATRLLVENIARHIASGKAERTAVWEVQKLQELGMLNRENAAIIRKALKSVPADVVAAMNAGSKAAYDWLLQAVPERFDGETRPPEEINAQYIDYWQQIALDKMNMTGTTMLESAQQAYLRAVNGVATLAVDTLSAEQEKAAYGALNAGTAGILSGGLTLDQAKKRAIEDMADEGIYGFIDRAGRHWTPEAYTSMVLRTTVHNVDIQSTKAMSQEFGVDVFQCSWHPNSRPSHYDYQGKFYSWNDDEGTFIDGNGEEHYYEPVSNANYGDAAGLFGINCGHVAFPMDPEVSIPFEESEIQPREGSDKGYAEAQKQRALERSIRDAKTKAAVYKTAGDEKKAKEWNAKVRERQGNLRNFLNETGRVRSRGREQVYGIAGQKEPVEQFSKKTDPREGKRFISDTMFERLTIYARKMGANILRGGEEVTKHLDSVGAGAATIGDTLLFRDKVTLSEALEETYHFRQKLEGKNSGKDAREEFLLNEIDAQKYLLDVAKQYKMPRSEIEEIRRHLEYYEKALEEFKEGK